ncbi:hypothetical protein PAXRUDRAFT_29072 [Paxillus rubicundulus Ve08.2h10]|uniref:Uncharacterized protein n=1 Tax=Paxillus rubicundulus Ve08.2h10 TaxID=930991 RepID=A0A0D0CWP7_9AGAM|nr:hypothetical protein PAXRUDRAFT_29072 [Paxillus rubicundulus Ve08.2h10]
MDSCTSMETNNIQAGSSAFPQAPGPPNCGASRTSSHVASVTTVEDEEDQSTTNGLRSCGRMKMRSVREGSWGDEGLRGKNENENNNPMQEAIDNNGFLRDVEVQSSSLTSSRDR